jgi:thioesterase domain-containing protein/acyl carrier protein
VVVGTEQASPDHVARFGAATGNRVRWFNSYGPIEATITATTYEHDFSKPLGARVPIGRPISNVYAYVLDPESRFVPRGVPGELCLGGIGLALGYHDRSSETNLKFISDPLQPGRTIYRTGDWVRTRWDGDLEFIGRRDFQIKRRGFRVELEEIEAVLAKFPMAERVAVKLHPGGRLAGYVEPRPGASVRREDLLAHMSARLPSHMQPNDLVVAARLPRTAGGKIDRHRLPHPADESGSVGRPPETDNEKRLAALFARILDVDYVAKDGHFFDLGGDSLKALELAALLFRETGRDVPLATMVRYPTVEALARFVFEGAPAAPTHALTTAEGSIVTVRDDGSGTPIFCVTGSCGNVLILRELAFALPSRPFLGIQLPGADGVVAPYRSITSVATQLAREIRARHPEGPYYVGGYSGGGIIAFEVIRQLTAEGAVVALAFVIDTPAERGKAETLRGRAGRHFDGLSRGGLEYLVDWARARGSWERDHWKLRAVRSTSRVLGRPTPQRFRDELMHQAWFRARDRYEMTAWPGVLEVFRTETTRLETPNLGWEEWVSEMCLHDVPGDHEAVLKEPLVSTLAERLDGVIRRAEARFGPMR